MNKMKTLQTQLTFKFLIQIEDKTKIYLTAAKNQ